MKIGVRAALAVSLLIFCQAIRAQGPVFRKIADVYTDKARYAPGETVQLEIALKDAPESKTAPAVLKIAFRHLGHQVGPVISKLIPAGANLSVPVIVKWTPPRRDFTGYFVDVRLLDQKGAELDRSQTAVDVSREWNRFPRYG